MKMVPEHAEDWGVIGCRLPAIQVVVVDAKNVIELENVFSVTVYRSS